MPRAIRVAFLTLAVIAAAVAGQPQTTISVTEVPPEAIPVGSCTEYKSGLLVIDKKRKVKDRDFNDKEIGEYVRVRLSQGYSLTLYPQASGKIYAIANCHTKP